MARIEAIRVAQDAEYAASLSDADWHQQRNHHHDGRVDFDQPAYEKQDDVQPEQEQPL